MKRANAMLAVALLFGATVVSADPAATDPQPAPQPVPVEAGSRADPLVGLPDPTVALAARALPPEGFTFGNRGFSRPGMRKWKPQSRAAPGWLESRETDKLMSLFSVVGPAGLIYLTFLVAGVYLWHRRLQHAARMDRAHGVAETRANAPASDADVTKTVTVVPVETSV